MWVQDYELPEDVANHLTKNYGTRALQVSRSCKGTHHSVVKVQ